MRGASAPGQDNDAPPHSVAEASEARPTSPPGRKFEPDHRWELSDPIAIKSLQDTPFGEQEINEFWTRKGWRLTQREEQYMTTTEQLLRDGHITHATHWSQTPFNDVFETVDDVTIDGKTIAKGTEFWMEFCENEDDIHLGNPHFPRVHGYKEEHQGHADQASDAKQGELRAGREVHR